REQVYFYLSAVGIIMAVFLSLKEVKEQGFREFFRAAPRHAIIIAPLVYFLFCMIDIQGIADLIPLLPFVGIFAAFALITGLDWTIKLIIRRRPSLRPAMLRGGGFAVFLALILFLDVSDAFSYNRDTPTLQEQEAAVAEVASHLQAG